MARTLIPTTETTRAGVEPTTANVDGGAAPDGMYFVWSETARLVVHTTGTATVATIDIPTTVDGQAVTDRAVSVAATTPIGEFIGPFGPEYRQANGQVHVNFSSATGATVAVID